MLTRTLDEELLALLRGEDDSCPVCGERVEGPAGRVECSACGSVVEEVMPPEGSLERA
jgi:hypothetical protein